MAPTDCLSFAGITTRSSLHIVAMSNRMVCFLFAVLDFTSALISFMASACLPGTLEWRKSRNRRHGDLSVK